MKELRNLVGMVEELEVVNQFEDAEEEELVSAITKTNL